MRLLLVLAFLFSLLFSCNKQTLEPDRENFGLEYFPLAIGHTWVYEMDSIVVRPVVNGVVFDSVLIQMQETLVDTFSDNSGQLWYRGERSFRANESEGWRFSATFLLGIMEIGALRKEGNLKFVPLGFPAQRGNRWDGNSAFSEFVNIQIGTEFLAMFNGWDYRIIDSVVPSESPEPDFPDVIRVKAADEDGLIERRFAIETYAKNVGLIYRELEIFDTQCENCCREGNEINTGLCLSLAWPDKAEKGFILRQRLIDFQP